MGCRLAPSLPGPVCTSSVLVCPLLRDQGPQGMALGLWGRGSAPTSRTPLGISFFLLLSHLCSHWTVAAGSCASTMGQGPVGSQDCPRGQTRKLALLWDSPQHHRVSCDHLSDPSVDRAGAPCCLPDRFCVLAQTQARGINTELWPRCTSSWSVGAVCSPRWDPKTSWGLQRGFWSSWQHRGRNWASRVVSGRVAFIPFPDHVSA